MITGPCQITRNKKGPGAQRPSKHLNAGAEYSSCLNWLKGLRKNLGSTRISRTRMARVTIILLLQYTMTRGSAKRTRLNMSKNLPTTRAIILTFCHRHCALQIWYHNTFAVSKASGPSRWRRRNRGQSEPHLRKLFELWPATK